MSARFDDRTIVINLYIRCLTIKRKQRILEKLLWFEHQKKTTDFTKTSYVRFSYVFASGRKYCLFSFLKRYYTKFSASVKCSHACCTLFAQVSYDHPMVLLCVLIVASAAPSLVHSCRV